MYIIKIVREELEVFVYSKRMTVFCQESARVFATEKQAYSYLQTSEFKDMNSEIVEFNLSVE